MSNCEQLEFYGWFRSELYDQEQVSIDPGGGGRLVGNLPLSLSGREGQASVSPGSPASFLIVGPPDVQGISPYAITGVSPAPDSYGVETTRCPYVSFSAPDLPWRYTPRPNPDLDPSAPGNPRQLAPWMVLLVGVTGEEIEPNPDGTLRVANNLLAAYPLDRSPCWAHVQSDGERSISRLLSARPLEPEREYTAAIVPAFDDAGKNRWDQNLDPLGETILPCYHRWRFWTGEGGDFKTLAAQLTVRSSYGVGVAKVTYAVEATGQEVVLYTPGALTGLGQTEAYLDPAHPVPKLAQARADLQPRVDLPARDEEGRPIVGLPQYGEAWHDDALLLPWGDEVNYDPRHRGIAGLGAWVAIERQESLAQAAADGVGDLDLATQRLVNLILGLCASGSLWERRLPRDPAHRLQIFGPSLLRIITQSGTARDLLTGGDSPLVSDLFSSAAGRVFRPGTARARLAQPGAFHPANLYQAANQCPPPPELHGPGLPPGVYALLAYLAQVIDDETLFDVLDTSQGQLDEYGIDLGWLQAFFAPLLGSFVAQCEPVDWKKFVDGIGAAIDPRADDAVVPGRILGGIQGLLDVPLAPVEVCIALDRTLWRDLRNLAPDWLLPGVTSLAADSIVAVETNPKFVEAFLLGLNSQLLGELRWRNIAIIRGCTPVKMFWDRVNPQAEDSDLPAPEQPPPQHEHDIRGIITWVGQHDNALGAASHRGYSGDVGNNLVVVFRTELFRRYPHTLVSLVAAIPDRSGEGFSWDWGPYPEAERKLPVFQGRIGQDLVFFGFDVPAAEVGAYWLLLEEPPPGFGFRNVADPSWKDGDPDRLARFKGAEDDYVDGATFAAAAFNDPLRVLISGEALAER